MKSPMYTYKRYKAYKEIRVVWGLLMKGGIPFYPQVKPFDYFQHAVYEDYGVTLTDKQINKLVDFVEGGKR